MNFAIGSEQFFGMFEEFPLYETILSAYVVVNWLICLFTTVWLFLIFRKTPFLFVKPSMVLLTITHMLFQWPLAVYSGFCEHFLLDPWVLPGLIHVYVIVGLLLSSVLMRDVARVLLARVTATWRRHDEQGQRGAIYVLLGAIVLILTLYFLDTPPSETGLYALFANPSDADKIRNRSFEQLPVHVKYLYSWMRSAVAPLTAALIFLSMRVNWQAKAFARVLLKILALLFILAIVSLSGARYDAAKIILTIGAVIIIGTKYRVFSIRALAVIALALIPAAIFTLMREGKEISGNNLLVYFFVHTVFHRVFVVPLQVGVWHIQYAQLVGHFGLGAIPKLAGLDKAEPVSVAQIIGNHYLPHSSIQTYSDAGYLLSYYSYFGWWSLPLSILLLLALDLALLFIYRLDGQLMLAVLAATSVCTIEFIQSDYTTSLVTHGFLPLVICAIAVHYLTRFRFTDGHRLGRAATVNTSGST